MNNRSFSKRKTTPMINSNLISLKDHFQFAIKSVSNSLSSQNWILKIKKMDHKKIIFNQKYKNKNLKKDSRKASSIENIKPDTSNSRKISIAKRLKIKSVLTKNKIQLKNPFKIQLKQSDRNILTKSNISTKSGAVDSSLVNILFFNLTKKIRTNSIKAQNTTSYDPKSDILISTFTGNSKKYFSSKLNQLLKKQQQITIKKQLNKKSYGKWTNTNQGIIQHGRTQNKYETTGQTTNNRKQKQKPTTSKNGTGTYGTLRQNEKFKNDDEEKPPNKPKWRMERSHYIKDSLKNDLRSSKAKLIIKRGTSGITGKKKPRPSKKDAGLLRKKQRLSNGRKGKEEELQKRLNRLRNLDVESVSQKKTNKEKAKFFSSNLEDLKNKFPKEYAPNVEKLMSNLEVNLLKNKQEQEKKNIILSTKDTLSQKDTKRTQEVDSDKKENPKYTLKETNEVEKKDIFDDSEPIDKLTLLKNKFAQRGKEIMQNGKKRRKSLFRSKQKSGLPKNSGVIPSKSQVRSSLHNPSFIGTRKKKNICV